jgi:hypothetical protein
MNETTLDKRVAEINKATHTLVTLAIGATIKGPDKAEPEDIAAVFHSIGILVSCLIVSLSEISDAVGKLAADRDEEFKAAVEQASETKANIKHNEGLKRNFIGQPRNQG